eukprot:2300947-Rhodomonas_salina.2
MNPPGVLLIRPGMPDTHFGSLVCYAVTCTGARRLLNTGVSWAVQHSHRVCCYQEGNSVGWPYTAAKSNVSYLPPRLLWAVREAEPDLQGSDTPYAPATGCPPWKICSRESRRLVGCHICLRTYFGMRGTGMPYGGISERDMRGTDVVCGAIETVCTLGTAVEESAVESGLFGPNAGNDGTRAGCSHEEASDL